MKELVVASGNRHKVEEIQGILGSGWRIRDLSDYPDAPKIAEDAETFAGNAMRKAAGLAVWLASRPHSEGRPDFVLADDSGLEVDALAGKPGVHSARFAAEEEGSDGNASDRANNEKLLRLLEGIEDARRTARFRCVLALVPIIAKETTTGEALSAEVQFFDGVCEGRIGFELKGSQGFGYDPLFIPEGYSCSFAELGSEEKNRISHRSRALHGLKAYLS